MKIYKATLVTIFLYKMMNMQVKVFRFFFHFSLLKGLLCFYKSEQELINREEFPGNIFDCWDLHSWLCHDLMDNNVADSARLAVPGWHDGIRQLTVGKHDCSDFSKSLENYDYGMCKVLLFHYNKVGPDCPA